MSEPSKIAYLSVEDYLKFEESSPFRHEYVRGQIFAMTGASEAHNLICSNLCAWFSPLLKGTGCRVYLHDMKVRIETADCFYYPDLVVTCEPYDPGCLTKTAPVLIAEVLSPSTKHVDRREKLVAYKEIPGLQHYLVVHQDRILVEVHARLSAKEWQFSQLRQSQEIVLDSIAGRPRMPVAAIYEGVDLPPVVAEPEAEYEFR